MVQFHNEISGKGQWVIAVTGITLRTIFFNSIPSIIGDGIFLLMGWVGVYSSWLVWQEYRWQTLVLSGLFYSIGAVINAQSGLILIDKVWGPHETFHLFVLAGIGAHWAFIWRIADPRSAEKLNL